MTPPRAFPPWEHSPHAAVTQCVMRLLCPCIWFTHIFAVIAVQTNNILLSDVMMTQQIGDHIGMISTNIDI